MIPNEDDRYGIRRRSAARLGTALLVAGCSLIPASESLGAIPKVNVKRPNGNNVAWFNVSVPPPVAAGASDVGGAAGFWCEPIVVAMVVGLGETVEIVGVTPGYYDTDVSLEHENLLAARLVTEDLYDPIEEHLFVANYHPPWPCYGTYIVVLEYRVVSDSRHCVGGDNDGHSCTSDWDCPDGSCEPDMVFYPDYLVGGGTNIGDLYNAEEPPGKELANFEAVYEEILETEAIPAVSPWGVVVLLLLALIGGKTYFGRRGIVQR